MTTLLKSNFGKIIKTEIQEDKVVSEVLLNSNHAIYQGHFPSKPITPGVCTLQMVRELLEVHLSTKLRLVKSKNVKFSSMIDPNITPKITIEIQLLPADSPQEVTIKAGVFGQGITFCKFDGEYKKQFDKEIQFD
jgi:3-hydroxyacyl-[acyl-carrier-protein] dehydratase